MLELQNFNATLALSFVIAAFLGCLIGYATSPGDWPWVLKIIGGLWIIVLLYLQTIFKEKQRQNRINNAETHYRDNPISSKAAWDLAQVKLESYIDRNIDHVRWIFFLSVFVMLAGCGLIFFGISLCYDSSSKITPAVNASVSGVLTQLLGGTILILYRSTMRQAKEYVYILERINAVGMSVQILEKHPGNSSGDREQAIIEIAKHVLSNYTISNASNNRIMNENSNTANKSNSANA